MAHILITNDDGIQAEGLRALVQAVDGLGTISVVAPSHERSASAQSLTLRQPIFWEQVAEREWAVEGTPADSVILALNKLLPNRPDLVISGINRGGNLGENIFYSGTVGAAMEAAINHIPAIAMSVAHKGRGFRFEEAAKFARDLAQLALAEGMPDGVLLNVNVPLVWNGSVRVTRQSKKVTRNVLQEGTDPRGRSFHYTPSSRPHARDLTRSSVGVGCQVGIGRGECGTDSCCANQPEVGSAIHSTLNPAFVTSVLLVRFKI